MKEVSVKLYRYEELSQEVKDKLIEKHRQSTGDWLCEARADEYRDSLEKFCDVFHVKMRHYNVDSCRFDFDFSIKRDYEDVCHDFELSELSGIRLYKWIMNNVYDDCIKGRYNSVDTTKPGERYSYRCRYSKVMFVRKDCPFTGCCYDEDLLDEFWKYIDKPDLSLTYYDLVYNCLYSFFKAWEDECAYSYSDEGVEESLMINEFEDSWHLEDGRIYRYDVA